MQLAMSSSDVEVVGQLLPALVVSFVQLLACLLSPLCDGKVEGGFEHERLCPLGHLDGPELPGGPVVEALGVGAVGGGTSRTEPLLLSLVLSKNESHELGHAVSVVVRGPEGLLGHGPPRGEDDKVCDGRALPL